ncbi:MAG: DHHA1 domain-containing protein [Acidobacteria bacterium]|nr:DHHA1 domain-containing protein [Acidobacteriota bacterium]MCA1640830.1 DHHA1 domain-containing protein [Acidobacteriota bacterium]
MGTTERLYYSDSHLTEFDAVVVAANEIAPGRAGLQLDRTAFYPTGGGQPHDTGTLGGARVVDCIDREAEGVLHVVEGAAPVVGARVEGRVDWARRLEHIQQHTGQHTLSQSFVRLFDAPTRSFRMLERVCEIDVELEEPCDEKIEQAVDLANRIVWEDRAVKVLDVTRKDAARLPLRKDSAREGGLRVVEIEDFDLSPCGGTHAKTTGEVGVILARSWERAKGLTRIEFAAGVRAVADYRLANRAARAVAAAFSVAREDAAEQAARLVEENKGLARSVRALEESAAKMEAAELIAEASRAGGGAGSGGGSKVVARVFEGRGADSLKRLASAITSHEGAVALLGAREGGETRLVFARAADASGDMSALMREACAAVGGRGGGRPEMAQGGGRGVEQLPAAIEAAARRLAETSSES